MADLENVKAILGNDFKEGMTPDEIVNALSTKKLADLSKGEYISKAKFAETEKAKSEFEKQLKDIQLANMTEQDKAIAEKKTLQDKLLSLQKQVTKTEVEKTLISGGLVEDDYKDFIDNLVSDDHDKSVTLAKSLVTVFKSKIENTSKQAKEDAVKSTTILPKPEQGQKAISSANETLALYREGKLQLAQSDVAYYTRLAQQEKSKK